MSQLSADALPDLMRAVNGRSRVRVLTRQQSCVLHSAQMLFFQPRRGWIQMFELSLSLWWACATAENRPNPHFSAQPWKRGLEVHFLYTSPAVSERPHFSVNKTSPLLPVRLKGGLRLRGFAKPFGLAPIGNETGPAYEQQWRLLATCWHQRRSSSSVLHFTPSSPSLTPRLLITDICASSLCRLI